MNGSIVIPVLELNGFNRKLVQLNPLVLLLTAGFDCRVSFLVD